MTVRKLNKRLIFWCLVGAICLSVPALVSLASFDKRTSNDRINQPQANVTTQDVFAISGTEKFPETYGDLKGFEEKLAANEVKEENFAEALAELEEQEVAVKPQAPRYVASGYGAHRDNPWSEAKERELKQNATDHFEARRSDIMFIDNQRGKGRATSEATASEDPMIKMMEKTLAMAQDQVSQPASAQEEMFFMKKGNPHKDFLGGNRAGIGMIKEPSAFMVSQGTLIDAILLSEINTDLPGPILARVSHNIWDSKTGKALLIPQNSKLIGEYNSTVGHGQNRAQIVWTRIIYPNQQSVDLGRMVGVDKKGTSGSAGKVDNHYDKVAMGLLMSTTVGAGVRMTQGKYDSNSASIGQDLGNALAQETGHLGNKIADKMLAIKPTIKVSMGERVNVFVEADLNLKPYEG